MPLEITETKAIGIVMIEIELIEIGTREMTETLELIEIETIETEQTETEKT